MKPGRPKKIRVKKTITRRRGAASRRAGHPAQKRATLGRNRRRRRG